MMMQNKQSDQLALFRQLIIHHFSESELRTLCFDLGHDYELLPGREKAEKARELIAYYGRINALGDLLLACQRARPQVEWPPIAGNVPLLSPTQPVRQRGAFWAGVAFLVILIGAAIFVIPMLGKPEDYQADLGQALPSLDNTDCIDAYLADIQQDYQAVVAIGETAHDFYFSDWGDRTNPSLLGLRLMGAGEPIAAVRFVFLPGSTRGNTAFEVVGVVDGDCQEIGDFSSASLLIENWQHLDLELPGRAVTISFNWQGDHLRLGVRQMGGS